MPDALAEATAPAVIVPDDKENKQANDEDYTIKCVCGYKDDDGNTVYCETCDSWQHIECYYPNEDVPEMHQCTDCSGRFINGNDAAARQRQLREEVREQQASKARRSTSMKKKRRPNGVHTDSNTKSPKDTPAAPPAKRPKTNHRSSASVAARANSASRSRQSPSKSPVTVPWSQKPISDQFSSYFMGLHSKRYVDITDGSNVFNDLVAGRDVSAWVQEPRLQGLDALGNVGNKSEAWYAGLSLNLTTVAEIEDATKEAHGSHPRWKCLRLCHPVATGHIVGELKGHIGRLEDYANDTKNRWYRRMHPEPFVFCPSRFPVFVDTRQEGSSIRFARRSCRPTAALRTIVIDGYHCHFFVETAQDLKQGAELTVPWEFGSSWGKLVLGGKTDERFTAAEYETAQPLVDGLLADHGGCACDKTIPCAFDQFYARESLSTSRKHKQKTSDDDEQSSTSSKPQSRDLTPMTPSDAIGTDMSDRERRKLMAQLSRIDQVEGKKKKRPSGTPIAAGAAFQVRSSQSFRKHRTDHQKPNGQPASPTYPSHYVHNGTQTDDEPNAWYDAPARPREFVPMAVRLLRHCHKRKMEFEERKRKAEELSPPAKRVDMKTIEPELSPVESSTSPVSITSPVLTEKALSPEINGHRQTDLRVTLPVGQFAQPPTPGSVPQTPFSVAPSLLSPSLLAGPTPSPIKKKMSLSDYAKRRAASGSTTGSILNRSTTDEPKDEVMKDASPTLPSAETALPPPPPAQTAP